MSAVGDADQKSGNGADNDTGALTLLSNQSTSTTAFDIKEGREYTTIIAASNPALKFLKHRWGRFSHWFRHKVTNNQRATAFAEEYELVSLSQHAQDAVRSGSDIGPSSGAIHPPADRHIYIPSMSETITEGSALDLYTFSSALFIALSFSTTTILSSLPTVIITAIVYDVTGRMYPSLALYLLRLLDAISVTPLICSFDGLSVPCITAVQVFPIVLFSAIDACIVGVMIPRLYWMAENFFFTEPDGTSPIEWAYMKKMCDLVLVCSYLASFARIHLIFSGILAMCSSRKKLRIGQVLFHSESWVYCLFERMKSMKMLARIAQTSAIIYLLGLFTLLAACLSSSLVYLVAWDAPAPFDISNCDPLDHTECILPFPSSFYLRDDTSTATGFRVNLTGDILPLKGNTPFVPGYLNEMDGFSTMAPILFYIHGLKEGGGTGLDGRELQGPESIGLSVTSKSTTLLIDVEDHSLVPHFAELDFLDERRPLVMMQPASPLKHNTRYAVAVVNATGADGLRLSPTPGFSQLLNHHHHDGSTSRISDKRASHFREVILPSFRDAVPWYNGSDPSSLQLLFDFHTASSYGQLNILHAVRESTLKKIDSFDWFSDDNINLIKLIDRDCAKASIGRSFYAELSVPWFLEGYGDGNRRATMNNDPYIASLSDKVGKVKFSVHVPCSVKEEIMDPGSGKPIRAVIDWGHGVLFSRGETDIPNFFLHKIANDNGYIIVGTDWRGMTRYDLPVIIRCLISRPDYFHAIRDNLIQGFVNKICLQYLVKNYLMKMKWLRFDENIANTSSPDSTLSDAKPEYVFYGNSQGGILGAGYNAFVGEANVISRTILGVPGTPFALVIGRSAIFEKFKDFLLLNLYHHRHTRILLSLFQMGWDTVEASGLLAQPVNYESIPRVLMQSGVGDSIVTSIATESLARAYRASLLPSNTRKIFGLEVAQPASLQWNGPHTTLTELYFEQEAKESDVERNGIPAFNNVHHCVHRDSALKKQLVEFINTGKVIDPCKEDNCWRKEASNHC